MIKKLQSKFILITMISVVVVLMSIITAINVVNYVNVGRNVDGVLTMLVDNGGRFPKPDPDKLGDMGDDNTHQKKDGWFDKRMSLETPYETRFFSACIQDGEIKWSNTGNVAAINSDEADEYVKLIAECKKTNGYMDNYRYMVKDTDEGTLVVCVDCTKQMETVFYFLRGSILISLVGITAIFILVVLLSGKVIRPAVRYYEKQKRFITDSSHELKTPLAVILANTEVIEMMNGESEWTDSIKNQVNRMSELTKDMTSLARMDEERFELSETEFNLSELVCEISREFRTLAVGKNIAYEEKIEDGIIYKGDKKRIESMVSIFLDNACKYTSGKVMVSLYKSKGKIVFDVYNTVSEIKKGDNKQFFDRFYRADESRSKEIEGFGIGLSIAKSIVELHGGKISAKSQDGRSVNITAVL